jgi:sulfide:quinone oxidoreductase
MSRAVGVKPHRVLIVGGGIAGIEALMALADLGDRRLHLELVAHHPAFVLRPQTVGEPWGGQPLQIDLERLCRAFGARFTLGTVTEVDPEAHEVRTTGGAKLTYERLLLAPGARPTLAYPTTRTLGFGWLPETLSTAGPGDVALVVPHGVTWTLPAYELALLIAGEGRDVRVLTSEQVPLEAFGPATRSATLAFLDRHHVTVDTGRTLTAGSQVNDLADTVIALPLLAGPAIDGLPHDEHGFIPVDTHMALPGAAHVWAAGDATRHRIKQGGLAGQQADVAAAEIVRSCGASVRAEPYAPVLRGKLTAPDGKELYLRRDLHAPDDGHTSDLKLWEPSGVVCAWRLARWLSYRRGDLEQYTLNHVAH